MIKTILGAGLLFTAFSTVAFADAGFYVAQDAKTHKCAVVDKAPDGKTMMDAGTKMYANKANAEQAMAALKACTETAMAPAAKAAAGFYVAQDAKSHKCMVMDKAPDGKTMTDAGTKVYANQANAEQALAALKACNEPAMAPAKAAAVGFYVGQDAKTHKCAVMDKAPDGKMAMDVGTKVYETQANAEKAASMLKVCNDVMAPAGFYVGKDAKTNKCAVMDKAPDGKMAMDVGTKMYETQANAEKALANLGACK